MHPYRQGRPDPNGRAPASPSPRTLLKRERQRIEDANATRKARLDQMKADLDQDLRRFRGE